MSFILLFQGTSDRIWLLAAALTCRQYFHDDREIAELATLLYCRYDFLWMTNGDGKLLSHGSRPEGFIPFRYDKYSQLAAMYLLGIGSATQPKRTSFRCPWQNGVAERWVGSCRRDLLDHVIVLNERHLKRLMSEYVCYYHVDRTHLALTKGTPEGRDAEVSPGKGRKVVSIPRFGGLHHRYNLAA